MAWGYLIKVLSERLHSSCVTPQNSHLPSFIGFRIRSVRACAWLHIPVCRSTYIWSVTHPPVMPEKAQRRVPPWEQARLNFELAERKRMRELEQKERPARVRLSDLEENRKRLAEIRKQICATCHKYRFSELLPEPERKIGERFGFCNCNNVRT